jgi:hypothetical protein
MFFEQRLILGGTNNQPQTVWTSQTGIFNNFAEANPLKDSDGIEATIVSRQVNEIRHFVPLQDLIIFTAGAEWKMTHGSTADALTPTSIQFKVQGYRGSSHVPPLVVGDTVLYLQRGGRIVRDLAYDLMSDAYKGSNLIVLADHLTRNNKIVSWAYQQNPYSVVWCVRDDGVLLGLTYMREHEVWAWHRHETDGKFLDVCVLEGDDADECYFLVAREINGETKYYIEKLAERMENDELKNAWIVDCGLRYEGAAAATISGLSHLEGKELAGLADGSPLPPLTVENGAVTLPRAASLVTLGLPYTSDLETLNIDLNAAETMQGRKKNIAAVTLRFENALGGFVGSDEDGLVEIKPPLPALWGEALSLRTDDYRISIPPAWNTNGRILFRQTQPLPVTILAVIPEVKIGG